MIAPLTRIIARYLASALVTYGVLSAPDAAAVEPDIVLALGVIIATATEAAYALAVRFGWTK